MAIVIGNGIGVPFQRNTIIDEMKYSQTITLTAGVETDITTTLADSRVIYNIFLQDSTGTVIEDGVTIRAAAAGGVWHIYITSIDAVVDAVLKIIY